MTRVITVIGGKGGIGKTTLVSNLSTALNDLGYGVMAVDANLTTPNLSLHMGMQLAPKTLHDVLRGEETLSNTIYPHVSGVKVIPGSMAMSDLTGVDAGRLQEVSLALSGKSDFVIYDGAAGLGREAISSIMAADEILIVTNPDLPSVADAVKTAQIARDLHKDVIGVVINRVKGGAQEMKKNQIEEILGERVIAEIPEDRNVAKSIASKNPIVHFEPDSPASVEMKRLAHNLVGAPFKEKSRAKQFGLIRRIVGLMTC